MLAVAGHEGMDLIDETDVWVVLNLGGADIVETVGTPNWVASWGILMLLVESLGC